MDPGFGRDDGPELVPGTDFHRPNGCRMGAWHHFPLCGMTGSRSIPVSIGNSTGLAGIRDLLAELTAFGWRPVEEGGKVIALSGEDGNVSLEPAGQLELSGAALENLHQTCAEAGRHLDQVKQVGEKLGLGFLGLGMWPDKTREDLPRMPKGRYAIMLRH